MLAYKHPCTGPTEAGNHEHPARSASPLSMWAVDDRSQRKRTRGQDATPHRAPAASPAPSSAGTHQPLCAPHATLQALNAAADGHLRLGLLPQRHRLRRQTGASTLRQATTSTLRGARHLSQCGQTMTGAAESARDGRTPPLTEHPWRRSPHHPQALISVTAESTCDAPGAERIRPSCVNAACMRRRPVLPSS